MFQFRDPLSKRHYNIYGQFQNKVSITENGFSGNSLNYYIELTCILIPYLNLGFHFHAVACILIGFFTLILCCFCCLFITGFGIYHELTYPITTQTIITDGKDFQFFCYQLNTIQLWKDKEANPLCNIMWSTDIMPLYEQIENNQVKGLNEDTFKVLLKFLLNSPVDRGVDLKPYLPDWDPPKDKKLFINHKGDEPLEHPVIERFQYPKYALYF